MSHPWIVLEFGGTSVSTPERWRSIAGHIRSLLPSHRVWVVASALAGVSDRLEAAIREATSGETPAYGAVMASRYNLREPAEEIVLGE